MTEKQKTWILWGAGAVLVIVLCLISAFAPPSFFQPTETSVASLTATTKATLCDINTASVKELAAVPGFDRDTALNIAAYREEHGRFVRLTDLLLVTDVTREQYQQALPYLTC